MESSTCWQGVKVKRLRWCEEEGHESNPNRLEGFTWRSITALVALCKRCATETWLWVHAEAGLER